MATNTIHVSDELLAELQARAEEAVRKGLEDRAWQDLLDYGRETGRASGYTAEDVPEIVTNRRKLNAQRR
jgi:hypothetical protein